MENLTYLLAKNQFLEGERILLRPVALTDAADMYEYASDEETTRFVFETHKDIEDTKNSIANYFVKDPIGKYGMVLKETQKFIGTIDIRVNTANKSAELGYTLNKHYWGKGYMTEAGQILLSLGFETLQLERISSLHDTRNPASGKVMQRLGMTLEGTLRKNRFFKGEFVDDAYYSILKEEY